MIGGVNGANVNLYSGFQNIREQALAILNQIQTIIL